MRTAELTGALLDYWVARAEVLETPTIHDSGNGEGPACYHRDRHWRPFAPSTSWAQGGPIIERQDVCLMFWRRTNDWSATISGGFGAWIAPTPLVAAMRAYVANKFGDEVEDVEGAA